MRRVSPPRLINCGHLVKRVQDLSVLFERGEELLNSGFGMVLPDLKTCGDRQSNDLRSHDLKGITAITNTVRYAACSNVAYTMSNSRPAPYVRPSPSSVGTVGCPSSMVRDNLSCLGTEALARLDQSIGSFQQVFQSSLDETRDRASRSPGR